MVTATLTGREGRKIEIPTGLFINNDFVPSSKNSSIDVSNPFSGEILATLATAETTDVDVAVGSATAALRGWKPSPPTTKSKLLTRLADLLEQNKEEMAAIHALDAGFVYDDVKNIDIAQSIETLRYFSGLTDKITGKTMEIPNGIGITHREPLGVCAAVIPWNAPLMITIWKLAPALAAGNVLIIKTPEIAPLYGQKLAQLIVEAGFPPGVVNILCGLGHIAGKALAEHMSIRKIAFTGSTTTGRRIMKAAAESNLKRVTLELGGKGSSIVFKDANLDNALFWTSIGSTANNGQVCALGSRIYVQQSIYDDFIEQFQSRAQKQPTVVGNPLEDGVTKGPIVNESQYERVMSYVRKGAQEGAKVLIGGIGRSVGSSGIVENTIFVDVREDMTIVREEIFGPVATIHRFETEQEVIEKANNSEYGLAAAIFTNNMHLANRVAVALEVGMVTINCWGIINCNMPFGGVKESGFGRDLGEDALDDWTNIKSIKYWHLNEDEKQ